MEKEPMTQYGFSLLTNELSHLKSHERPATVIALDEARQLGDLKENAEYHAAKEKLALIDIRIGELNDVITKAVVVDPSILTHDRVSFGSTIKLIDIDTDDIFEYTIVGACESDPSNGKISFNSPLAKQLLGKTQGVEVKVTLPSGTKEYEIEDVYYKEF
jgi:transcription elongation factor GreA